MRKKTVWFPASPRLATYTNFIVEFLELPVQHIFGYGTKWERVLIAMLVVVVGLAVVFWAGHGIESVDVGEGAVSFWDSLYFSVITVTTLGYGDFHPEPGLYRFLASSEAVFGAFMWAAFIAIFARKYTR